MIDIRSMTAEELLRFVDSQPSPSRRRLALAIVRLAYGDNMTESREDEFRRMFPNQAAREDSRDSSLCVTCGKQCEVYTDEPDARNQCFNCCPHAEGWTYDRGIVNIFVPVVRYPKMAPSLHMRIDHDRDRTTKA